MIDDQDDRTPLLSQRGGVWYPSGFFFARMSWPFGKLTVFRDHFELNGARFTRESVTTLRRIRGLSAGLRITHSNPNTTQGPIFWSRDFPSLRTALEQTGFHIEEPTNALRDNPVRLFVSAWILMLAIGGLLALWTSWHHSG